MAHFHYVSMVHNKKGLMRQLTVPDIKIFLISTTTTTTLLLTYFFQERFLPLQMVYYRLCYISGSFRHTLISQFLHIHTHTHINKNKIYYKKQTNFVIICMKIRHTKKVIQTKCLHHLYTIQYKVSENLI